MRLYLDASTVIFLIEGGPPLREKVRARLRRSVDAGDELVASDLTRFECRIRPLRSRDYAALDAYAAFFTGAEVVVEPVSRSAWDLAAKVRAEHGLKTPDAIHVACALSLDCELLLTGDERLTRCPAVASELMVP